MSERRYILRKPVWRALAQRPGVSDPPLPALKAADGFLDYRVLHKISNPELQDFGAWAKTCDDPDDALLNLSVSMALIAPSLVKRIDAARDSRVRDLPQPVPDARAQVAGRKRSELTGTRADRAKAWDPIAPAVAPANRGQGRSPSSLMTCRPSGRQL